jgi:hypothetical protein
MEQQAVEQHLPRHIDDLAAGMLRKLTIKGFASLTLEDRCDWVRFLLSLRLRQPEIVQQLRVEFSEHLEALLREEPEEYDAVAEASDPPTLVELTSRNYPGLVENFGLSCFHGLVDNPEMGQKNLSMKRWLWDFTREQIDLLLADQPCIDEADLIVALPIGPRKAFLATKSDRVASAFDCGPRSYWCG